MGHNVISKDYYKLQKRLSKSPQGVSSSDSFFKILEIIFTEKEAKLVSVLPMAFFTKEKAAKIWKIPLWEAEKELSSLASKGILFDFVNKKSHAYSLAPPIPGFFEFALMRSGGKVNKEILAKLFHQYVSEGGEVMKSVYINNPSIIRVFPQEETIKDKAEILDYEKAKFIIETAKPIAVKTCYCRHKMEHAGKKCEYPQETCMAFNGMADGLIRNGLARKIGREEALKILKKCMELGLVQIGDNVKNEVLWICNCCACCCEVLNGYKAFGYSDHHKNNYYIKSETSCVGCGICVNKCPVNALSLTEDKNKEKKVKIDLRKCIGCGVCGRFCPKNNLMLKRKKRTNRVPENLFEKMILAALDDGKLQNYLFDNYSSITHSILRKFIGVILSLGPKQALLANKQLQSNFLKMAFKSKKYTVFKNLFLDK